MQHVVVIPYRHFETTYQSHLPGLRIKKKKSVRNYHYMLHNNSDEHSSLVNVTLHDIFMCSDWLITQICL